jgi:hypothetical protein
MKDFFREWGRRLDAHMSMFAVVVSVVVLFCMLRDGFDHSKPALWYLLFASILLPLLFFKRAWRLNFSWSDEPRPPPPTPTKLRQQRILAVADTVDGLPGGITLEELCEKLNEKQTRKLLHQMHRTRPGNRHLRDMAHLWLSD